MPSLQSLKQLKRSAVCVIESVNAKGEELKENVRETFDKIAEIAKKRRSELLEEVDQASLAKTTQLDMQREGLMKIKDGLQLTLDTGTTVCSQYDSVELLAVKDYIEKASQSYIEEAQSVELSPVCISNLTWVADENMIEMFRNYGDVQEYCDSEWDESEELVKLMGLREEVKEDNYAGRWTIPNHCSFEKCVKDDPPGNYFLKPKINVQPLCKPLLGHPVLNQPLLGQSLNQPLGYPFAQAFHNHSTQTFGQGIILL